MALVSAGLLALSLAGCATDTAEQSSEGDLTSTPQTLKISWLTGESQGLKAVVAAFETDYPNITVEVSTADAGPLQASMRTELAAGTAADVIWAWSASNAGGIRVLDEADYLVDLSDQSWASDYQPGVANQTQSADGRTLIMAPLTMGMGAIYNQTKLDELGIEPPETWDDVWAYCDAAVAAGLIPYAIPGGTTYGNTPILNTIASQLVYGDPETGETTLQFNDDFAAGTATFPDTDSWVQTFDEFQEFADSNCVEDNVTGVDWTEADRLLGSGEALAAILSTNRIGGIKAMDLDSVFELHAFDSDNNPLTMQNMLSVQGGGAIPASGKNIELAKFFLQYLADNARVYWSQHDGTAVALQGVLDDVSEPNVEFMQNVLNSGNNTPFLNAYWCPETEAAMMAGSQAMYTHSMTATEVLESMQAAEDAC
ncbi:MAG: ABC transporter substrate-binding protein [Protaetiibacter sp.]